MKGPCKEEKSKEWGARDGHNTPFFLFLAELNLDFFLVNKCTAQSGE
jgi:hypothetical protein